MNKMIFVAALLLAACSPKQDKLPDNKIGNLQNIAQPAPLADNNVQINSKPNSDKVGFTDNSENDNVVDENSDGSPYDSPDVPTDFNWKDYYKNCTDNLSDTAANRAKCETRANRQSGMSEKEEANITLLAAHEKDIDRTVFKPCMKNTNNYEKCSALTAAAMDTTP